jgi:hypothetical protein
LQALSFKINTYAAMSYKCNHFHTYETESKKGGPRPSPPHHIGPCWA